VARSETRLRIDPVACDGIGICSHLAPTLVGLDSWGFPLLPRRPLSRAELGPARRVVAACPRRALFLDPEP
jgi:ferredoxin